MGKKFTGFRMNEQVETQLNVLELMIKDKPERFLHAPENRSALINLMLGDYANFLITNFKKGKNICHKRKCFQFLSSFFLIIFDI